MSRYSNADAFKGILPYSSELFGVYQPLIGWKSQRTMNKYLTGHLNDRSRMYGALLDKFRPAVLVAADGRQLNISKLAPSMPAATAGLFDSTLVRELGKELGSADSPNVWDNLNAKTIQKLLDGPVKDHATASYEMLQSGQFDAYEPAMRNPAKPIADQLNKESSVAGLLLALKDRRAFGDLKYIVFDSQNGPDLLDNFTPDPSGNPFDTFDPKKDLDRVGLSPIGVVHLFREYFFELDTFLGVPVGHVWLSPGGSVELVEVSTRKTIIEQTIEASTQVVRKSESSDETQDDISLAVKENNQTNTKFGANASSNQNWVWGSANESASFGLDKTQQNARENVDKHMRQQSKKMSEEITTNYKTTFKTISENTDLSSKRYVLANTTDKLINYELRRKMQQIGVQVQDVGTYMCWQTYVDDAGKNLGIADLVHIAKPPDLPADPNPNSTPIPQPIRGTPVTFQYTWVFDDRKFGFMPTASQQILPPQSGYIFDRAEIVVTSGPAWYFRYQEDASTTTPDGEKSITALTIGIQITPDGMEDDSRPEFTYQFTPIFVPTKALLASVDTANKQASAAAANNDIQIMQQTYAQAAADRIKAASQVTMRPYDELREEERIVVYRALLQDLLTKGITLPDDRTRHVVSELLNSIFDIDKMLYFVAPEWWRPRLHHSHQLFGSLVPQRNADGSLQIGPDGQPVLVPDPSSHIGIEQQVSWGGAEAVRDDNYYITGDSTPARLGSSLGWLLQLDGDNLRNAFLNSPWVKAVIPIRPHRERAALNWLQQIEGMDGISTSDMYAGEEPEYAGMTVLAVLQKLADDIDAKHTESNTTKPYADAADPMSTVMSTPVDMVYEQGFDPLQGGFRVAPEGNFEIFDQWVEILPTDQVVPVEVVYDPKTGRQI